MEHVLPEYTYIVGFLACFVAVFIVSHLMAWATGWKEK
jgi:hypothetical protein